eukprot:Em0004g533a
MASDSSIQASPDGGDVASQIPFHDLCALMEKIHKTQGTDKKKILSLVLHRAVGGKLTPDCITPTRPRRLLHESRGIGVAKSNPLYIVGVLILTANRLATRKFHIQETSQSPIQPPNHTVGTVHEKVNLHYNAAYQGDV